jgi:hypothetical protein
MTASPVSERALRRHGAAESLQVGDARSLERTPGVVALVTAELADATESAVISPSKSETFDTLLDAWARALFPACVVASPGRPVDDGARDRVA